MPVYIIHKADNKKPHQVNAMDRNRKKKDNKNEGFNNCLQRVKGVSCPRGGIRGFMMNKMHHFKKPGMVHDPVGPIKISIMHYNH